MSLAVRMRGVGKSFGSVRALDEVDLEVEAGTLHAIVGENGAGKTTLMKVLYGVHPPTRGTFEVFGEPRIFRTSAQAIAAGVGMVSQHYAIIPELTCLQNLMLGAEGGPILNLSAAEARAESLAGKMGFQFDWSAPAATLSPGAAQKLEILKLLWRDSRIMILDEPTAMLSPADADALFVSLRRLVEEGATVLLVTHRLPEVMDHCRAVTVLRGGKLVQTLPVAQTTRESLARAIIGGGDLPPTDEEPGTPGEVVLKVENLVVRGDRAQDALREVSFEVRSGEVVGIAGVDGSGQRELFQALLGLLPARAGTIELLGSREPATPRRRLEQGLRIIPEDRLNEAVIEEWSLDRNAGLGLHRRAPLARGGTVDLAERRRWAERVAARFQTKHGGLDQPMRSLSGGNQQRFVAARALESDPRLILAFQPARGLDIRGTADIYHAIRERCAQGAAALVVSFDLDELLEHCDRILTLNLGVLRAPSAEQAKDREVIGRLMVGAQ